MFFFLSFFVSPPSRRATFETKGEPRKVYLKSFNKPKKHARYEPKTRDGGGGKGDENANYLKSMKMLFKNEKFIRPTNFHVLIGFTNFSF